MIEKKRMRLSDVDLETIEVAIKCQIDTLEKQLAEHEASEARFKQPDEWIRENERLNMLLTNSKAVEQRIEQNLNERVGRTEEPYKYLLNLSTRDKPGEYIRVLEASKDIPLEFPKSLFLLTDLCERGIISGFMDKQELKVCKLDALRLAAYMKNHKPASMDQY